MKSFDAERDRTGRMRWPAVAERVYCQMSRRRSLTDEAVARIFARSFGLRDSCDVLAAGGMSCTEVRDVYGSRMSKLTILPSMQLIRISMPSMMPSLVLAQPARMTGRRFAKTLDFARTAPIPTLSSLGKPLHTPLGGQSNRYISESTRRGPRTPS